MKILQKQAKIQKMYLYNFFKYYGEKQQQEGKTTAEQRADLMQLLAVSRATMSNLERATVPRLSPAEIRAICLYFDCSESDFVNSISVSGQSVLMY